MMWPSSTNAMYIGKYILSLFQDSSVNFKYICIIGIYINEQKSKLDPTVM